MWALYVAVLVGRLFDDLKGGYLAAFNVAVMWAFLSGWVCWRLFGVMCGVYLALYSLFAWQCVYRISGKISTTSSD